MTFTLRITFSGLCLFVPEAVGGAATGRMHVLMPGMFGHHHHGTDRHIAALSYDAGSLVQGGPVLGVPSLATLSGLALEFGSGDTAELGLCGHIPDLREITGRGVDPDQLGPDTRGKLASRVTLRAGRITGVAPGVCWEWRPGEFRPIAHKVEWEIPRVKGDRLAVMATRLGGGGAPKSLGTLFPTGGRLNLEVYHDTTENLPPEPVPIAQQAIPAPGEHPRHFSAFYDVFGDSVPTLLPRYRGNDCPPVANPCGTLEEEMGGTPYTCLVAGVGT